MGEHSRWLTRYIKFMFGLRQCFYLILLCIAGLLESWESCCASVSLEWMSQVSRCASEKWKKRKTRQKKLSEHCVQSARINKSPSTMFLTWVSWLINLSWTVNFKESRTLSHPVLVDSFLSLFFLFSLYHSRNRYKSNGQVARIIGIVFLLLLC